MSSVQFYGLENVVDAFANRCCNAWALAQGRQHLVSNVSETDEQAADQLQDFLQRIEESGTTAGYTLYCFQDWPTDKKINAKSAVNADASFNFKFVKPLEPAGGYQNNSRVEQRLAGIEKALAGKDDDEQEQSTIGKIGDYIEANPWAQQLVAQLAGAILKHIPGFNPALTPAQSLAGVPGDDDKAISEAVANLRKRDPKFTEHITKLSKMDDATLNYLFSLLDQMPMGQN